MCRRRGRLDPDRQTGGRRPRRPGPRLPVRDRSPRRTARPPRPPRRQPGTQPRLPGARVLPDRPAARRRLWRPAWQTARVAEITDDYMREQMTRTRGYSVVLLHAGERYGSDGADKIIWEHGRNNFSMRADGLLS